VLWQEEERCKIHAFHPSIRFISPVPRIVLTAQQVAVSHCKAGKGIIKVNGRPLALVEVRSSLRFFLSQSLLHPLSHCIAHPPSAPHSSPQPPVLRAKLIEPIAVLGLQVTPPPSYIIFPLCVLPSSVNRASLRLLTSLERLLVRSLAICFVLATLSIRGML
jgi:hypothetical protein